MDIITSTKRASVEPALQALPDSNPAEPTVAMVERSPITGQITSAIVSGEQFSFDRPYQPGSAFQSMMDSPVTDMLRLGSSVLTMALPDAAKYAVKGTWFMLDVTDKGMTLWDKLQLSEEDRAKAENRNAVPIAALDLGAQVLGGVALAGSATAGKDALGGALRAPIADIASNASLLVKAGSVGVAGGDVGDFFVEAALGQNPVYGFSKNLLGTMDRLSTPVTPTQLTFAAASPAGSA